jgi:hypothetical protein
VPYSHKPLLILCPYPISLYLPALNTSFQVFREVVGVVRG